MSKRKATPSAEFDSWLTGSPTKKPEPVNVVSPKSESKKVVKDESVKVKASYHLDVQTVQRIDEIQFRLKQLTRLRGRNVSKSRIIDAALRLAADDLDANGLESAIALVILEESKKT